jgi:hypothetical protein
MSIGASPGVVLIGGETLLKSTNTGMNWSSPINVPGSGNILGITGENDKWWLIKGNSIYYSSDTGENWVLDYTAPSGTYTHIYKSPFGMKMWAVRDNGGISYTDGITAINPASNFIPKSFLIYQNYPNPFNPVTKINYDLPVTNYVKLAVYDILGREVAVLVSGKQSAGTAGDFIQTRKMMLLK